MTYNPDSKFAVFVNQVTGAADLKGATTPIEGGFFIVAERMFLLMLKISEIRRKLDGGKVAAVAAYVFGSFALLVFMVAVIGLSFVAAAFAAKGGAL
jgi:hypothetical protein